MFHGPGAPPLLPLIGSSLKSDSCEVFSERFFSVVEADPFDDDDPLDDDDLPSVAEEALSLAAGCDPARSAD